MIRICGIPFKFVREETRGIVAELIDMRQEILVDDQRSQNETLESGVLHEIIHHLDEQYDLGLGEVGVQAFEASLFESLTGAGIDFSPFLDRIAEDMA